MRIIGGHNTDYQQVNAINGIMSPEFPRIPEFRRIPNSPVILFLENYLLLWRKLNGGQLSTSC